MRFRESPFFPNTMDNIGYLFIYRILSFFIFPFLYIRYDGLDINKMLIFQFCVEAIFFFASSGTSFLTYLLLLKSDKKKEKKFIYTSMKFSFIMLCIITISLAILSIIIFQPSFIQKLFPYLSSNESMNEMQQVFQYLSIFLLCIPFVYYSHSISLATKKRGFNFLLQTVGFIIILSITTFRVFSNQITMLDYIKHILIISIIVSVGIIGIEIYVNRLYWKGFLHYFNKKAIYPFKQYLSFFMQYCFVTLSIYFILILFRGIDLFLPQHFLQISLDTVSIINELAFVNGLCWNFLSIIYLLTFSSFQHVHLKESYKDSRMRLLIERYDSRFSYFLFGILGLFIFQAKSILNLLLKSSLEMEVANFQLACIWIGLFAFLLFICKQLILMNKEKSVIVYLIIGCFVKGITLFYFAKKFPHICVSLSNIVSLMIIIFLSFARISNEIEFPYLQFSKKIFKIVLATLCMNGIIAPLRTFVLPLCDTFLLQIVFVCVTSILSIIVYYMITHSLHVQNGVRLRK